MGLQIYSPYFQPIVRQKEEEEPFIPEKQEIKEKVSYEKSEDWQNVSMDVLREAYNFTIWSQRPSVDAGGQLYAHQKEYSLHNTDETPEPIMASKFGTRILTTQPSKAEFQMTQTDKEIHIKFFWKYLGKRHLIKTWHRPLPEMKDR